MAVIPGGEQPHAVLSAAMQALAAPARLRFLRRLGWLISLLLLVLPAHFLQHPLKITKNYFLRQVPTEVPA